MGATHFLLVRNERWKGIALPRKSRQIGFDDIGIDGRNEIY